MAETPEHLEVTSSSSGSVKMSPEMQSSCTSDADSGCAIEEFSWVPPGLTPQQILDYMCSLPPHCVPYSYSQHRTAQLLRQLPPHDSHVRYCHGLSDEEKRELKQFSAERARHALGRGTVRPIKSLDTQANDCDQCAQCGDVMQHEELAVFASRAGNVRWHPACFVCSVCNELLVDLIYFCGSDGRIYCGRHHAETLKPRCVACDEIIFSEECTEAEGSSYHTKHFVCANCDTPLGGQRYVMRNGRPHCCACYEQLFAATCSTCLQTIAVGEGHMVHGSHWWHATDVCYRCESCDLPLGGRAFVMAPDDEKIFCVECGVQDSSTIPDRELFVGYSENSPLKPMNCIDDLLPARAERPDVVSDNVAFVDNDRSMKEEVVEGLNGLELKGSEAALASDEDMLAVPNHEQRKSRKTKNVRFDPSTKDARSPASRDVYRQYARSLNSSRHGTRSGCACHGCRHGDRCEVGESGSKEHYHRHHHRFAMNGYAATVDGFRQGAQREWSVDGGEDAIATGVSSNLASDECDECSTCSSSSSDSEFDYSSYLPSTSQTLPSSSRRARVAKENPSRGKQRRHKAKNCVIS